jgi:glyoxylase-like metal-dependent hydrolase (beta-lactamase superfamily II)
MLGTDGHGEDVPAGNITVLAGPDGVLMVDTGQLETAEKVLAAIRAITASPLRYVIDTHRHGDHLCANAKMHAAGAKIIAQENVIPWLETSNAYTPRPAPGGMPQTTYKESMSLHFDGEDIELFHPHKAHTDGDTVVFFRKANVMATGDIFVNGTYPYQPAREGAGVTAVIAALERMLAMTDEKTIFVPGHGPVGDRADVQELLAMLKDARARVLALKDQGLDRKAVRRRNPLKDLNAKWGKGSYYTARDLATWIYEDLSQPHELEPTAAPPVKGP